MAGVVTDLMRQSPTCVAVVQHAWPSVYRMLNLTVKTRIANTSKCDMLNNKCRVMSSAKKNTIVTQLHFPHLDLS